VEPPWCKLALSTEFISIKLFIFEM
jgi:hypothetical protein